MASDSSSHGQSGTATLAAPASAPARSAPSAALAAGRAPPHSPEAEEHLLGCCLLDGSESIARCLELRLPPAAFYSPANRVIYEKICDIYQKSPPVDVAVLAEELKTSRQLDAIGGYAYLSQLSSRIPTTAQAQYFIDKVR
jgi:replicative DNA helicase